MRLRLPNFSRRTWVGIGIAAGIFALGAISSASWYGYRVYTELSPGSWRAPTEVLDRNKNTLVALYGSDWRVAEPVRLNQLPNYVPNAFLAAEDTRFWHHIGIDPIGIGRALVSNIKAGGVAEGGSTITQQLAKMRFLSQRRTFARKLAEIPLAIMIELRLKKSEILEAYLNEVYLGNRDGREVRGLGEASRVYFSKPPEQLTVAEAALLAGMVRAPNRDNPEDQAKAATQRRNGVIEVMLEKKWIDKAHHDDAIAAPAEFHPGPRRARPYPFLLAALRQEFIDRLGERALTTGGIKIYTPIDKGMQNAAEAAVRSGTANLRRAHGFLQRRRPLQAALLSVEPRSGGVRALVGGSDFQRSQYDRTRLMRRQLGSAAKPFTYAAAIASKSITTASIVDDAPVQIQLASNKVWNPKDYDDQFRGPVTVREAFEMSLNVPAVRVAQAIGVSRVQDVWHQAGFSGDLSNTPAIALGVDDVSMRDVVSAYSMFANLGPRSEPYLIERVTKGQDKEIYHYDPQLTDAIDPAVAYIIHSLMRGVVMRGTASRLNSMGLGDLAGKTGTTSNYRDAWFVGYAPDLLTAVWVGFDDGTPLRMSSGESAVPIWGAYMQKAPHASGEIRQPPGVTITEVEAMTGRLWQPGCGPSVTEVFLTGTEPSERCGGPFEGSFAMGEFTEPPMMTDEQMQEMSQGMDMRPPEVIHDPDSADMSSEDSSGEESAADSVRVFRPRADSMRRSDTTRRERVRVIPPPPPPPPPQVIVPPPPPPVIPPPPPPPPPA